MIDQMHIQDEIGLSSRHPATEPEIKHRGLTPRKKNILLVAGAFGLGGAVLLAATPELGLGSAIAGLFAGGASAVTTILARR